MTLKYKSAVFLTSCKLHGEIGKTISVIKPKIVIGIM